MVKIKYVLMYFLVSCMICFPSSAIESFDDGWSSYTASGTWSTDPSGSVLYASVSGDYGYGSYYKTFTGAMGTVATINVSSTTGCCSYTGLWEILGSLPSGNYVHIEFDVVLWDSDDYLIQYLLLERDPDTGETIRTISRGYIGEGSGSDWSVGESITLGYGLDGNIISYYSSVRSDMIGQIVMEDQVTPMDSAINIFGYSESDGAMSFSCTNLNVAYSTSELLGYMGFTPSYEVYIPHITGGYSDWVDYLQTDNTSSASASFTLILYDSTGTVVYNALHSLDALSRSKTIIDLKALSGAADAQCGKITYSDPGLQFRLSQENLLGGGVAEFRLTDELNDDLGFFFSDFSVNTEWKGIAMSNIGAEEGTVTLSAVGDGSVLESVDVSIGAYQKILGLYETWFPDIDFDSLDAIVTTSTTGTTCGIAISGNDANSLLLFTSGTPLE